MKRVVLRCFAAALAVLMTVSLCACGETTPTTTAKPTTTTVADEITTTVADETTTTVTDETTTTVAEETTAAPTVQKPTAGKVTVTTRPNDPWRGDTKPKKSTTTVQATTTRAPYTNVLAPVQRDPQYANEQGIYHILKGYVPDVVLKASDWLPTVGYVKDGEVVDAMYTAVTIQPAPVDIYHGGFNTKAQWDAWRRHTYQNLKGLNEAAAMVQEALQLKEHKVKVFLTLANPDVEIHDQWGILDGTMMTAASDEQRFTMIKYMIDSYIAEMKELDLPNIEFAGFYWFDEYVYAKDLAYYKRVTDYIRSLDKITMISFFYKATGWQLPKEAGFDLSSMQSNYFPNGDIGGLNCGSDKRLPANAHLITSGQSGGIEMELDNHKLKDGVTGLKKTFKVGVETGIVNGYHVHYIQHGPVPIYTLSKSRDEYFRSAYDELYKYMHNTLTVEDIWLEPIEREQGVLDGYFDWV